MTTSTNLFDYLLQGTAAARPVTPNNYSTATVLYYATDTDTPSLWANGAWHTLPVGAGIGVSDGDKGDIVVSSSGTDWAFDSSVVTAFAKTFLDDANAAAAATTLGLGTGDSPQFTAVNIGHASDTTVTRTGAGDIAVEGNAVYRAGGTDVPVADGGTGSSTAGGARTNLGLLRLIAFFFTTTPTISEVLCFYVAVDAFTIPANMSGSQVKVGTNATATFDIDVQQNGSTIGTISIATSGTPTLTTTSGAAKSIAAGDVLKFVAPSSADATIANVSVNIKGTL